MEKSQQLLDALGIARRDEAARHIYRDGLLHHPGDGDLTYALALTCYALGDYDEAAALCDQMLATNPQDASLLINAGKIYKDAGRYAQAEMAYRRALALQDTNMLAQAAFNYAHLLLLQQRWRPGFTAYESRFSLPGAMPVPFGLPVMNAQTKPGSHILLWSDQGLGDAIMFARFIPALRAKGYKISLLVQEPLLRLFQNFPGIEQVYGPGDRPDDCDAALGLGSLPYILSADPFGGETYLQTSAEHILPSTQKKRVGLVWAGNKAHINNKSRSIALDEFAPLLKVPNIEFYSLQKNHDALLDGLHDLSPLQTDMAATAALIAQMDLVISVDTSAAHLAGAVGKPVWVFLPRQDSDWRWGLSGDSSIWYPSMRLFRQYRAGDWAGPVASVAARLEKNDF